MKWEVDEVFQHCEVVGQPVQAQQPCLCLGTLLFLARWVFRSIPARFAASSGCLESGLLQNIPFWNDCFELATLLSVWFDRACCLLSNPPQKTRFFGMTLQIYAYGFCIFLERTTSAKNNQAPPPAAAVAPESSRKELRRNNFIGTRSM